MLDATWKVLCIIMHDKCYAHSSMNSKPNVWFNMLSVSVMMHDKNCVYLFMVIQNGACKIMNDAIHNKHTWKDIE